MKMNKKGIALNQAFGAVLTLVLIAVLVIIAIFMFVSLGATFTGSETVTVQNETFTVINETARFGAQSPTNNATVCNYAGFTILLAMNRTGGQTIAAANYTIVSATGSIAYSGAVGGYNNTDWNITSQATNGGAACTANNAMITQFATYPALVGLVGTIIFLGLVIGVLVASFVFGGRKGV